MQRTDNLPLMRSSGLSADIVGYSSDRPNFRLGGILAQLRPKSAAPCHWTFDTTGGDFFNGIRSWAGSSCLRVRLKPAPSGQNWYVRERFPRIITTNYDRLFQRAAAATASGHAFVAGPRLSTAVSNQFVWNIHGGLDSTEALVVTEDDIARFEAMALLTLKDLRDILAQGPLLVEGTSLRDPSILRLFRELRGSFEGYWNAPPGDPVAVKRALDLGITPIEAPVDGVIEGLKQRIK